MMLLSPTEHDLAYNPVLAGHVVISSLPEKVGADVLIVAPRGKMGIQRKTFPDDLLASLEDGRLSREIAALQGVEYRLLLLEGRPRWTADGHLMSKYASRWTRTQIRNLLRSARWMHDVAVEYTDDLTDTAFALLELETWFRKETHRSLLSRPKRTSRDTWGSTDNRNFALFFLQGLPGVGSTLAEAILDHFGCMPIQWTCTPEELMQVRHVGEKRAKALWESLRGKPHPTPTLLSATEASNDAR